MKTLKIKEACDNTKMNSCGASSIFIHCANSG